MGKSGVRSQRGGNIEAALFAREAQIAKYQVGHTVSCHLERSAGIERNACDTSHDFKQVTKQLCKILIVLDYQHTHLIMWKPGIFIAL
nr:hypothetical protein [Noviherbaspirillum saxi]